MNTSILVITAIIAAVGTMGSFSTPAHAFDLFDSYYLGLDYPQTYRSYNVTGLDTNTGYLATIALSKVDCSTQPGGLIVRAVVEKVHTPQGWIDVQRPTWMGNNIDIIKFSLNAVGRCNINAGAIIF